MFLTLSQSPDIVARNNAARQAQLDQKRVTSGLTEVEEFLDEHLAELNRVYLHLQKVIQIARIQVRNLNCGLSPTLAELLRLRPHQR
jgi:hypothetical protein